MKRITAVLLILILTLSLCSCSVQRKTYKVALIVKSTESDFWKSVYAGALAAGSQHNLEISFIGTIQEKDYRQQTVYIDQAIKNKYDAIVLAAGDYDLMVEPMERAVKSGIPVVLVDSTVNSGKWTSSISTDNYKAGRTLAEEMVKRLPPKSNIGVIGFVKNASSGIERERGFVDYINHSSSMKIVDIVYCDSNIDTAADLTRSILRDHPEITALAGLNAQAATGAARALDGMKSRDVYLGGIDCTVEEADYMDRGILRVAVLQNPYMMGYYSMETTAKVLNHQAYQRTIYIDVCVVDKSNMFSLKNQQLIFPFN